MKTDHTDPHMIALYDMALYRLYRSHLVSLRSWCSMFGALEPDKEPWGLSCAHAGARWSWLWPQLDHVLPTSKDVRAAR